VTKAITQEHPVSYNAGWSLLENCGDSIQQLILRASDKMHSEDR
jgi:hypothetical protein